MVKDQRPERFILRKKIKATQEIPANQGKS
jgi:hypothetical protein